MKILLCSTATSMAVYIKLKLHASDNTTSTIVWPYLELREKKILHSWSEAVLLRFIQGQINFNKNFQSPAISPPPGDISSASNEISLHRSLAKYRSGKYWRNRKHQTRSYLHRLFTSRRESKLRNASPYQMMRRKLNRNSWKFLPFTSLYCNVITSK